MPSSKHEPEGIIGKLPTPIAAVRSVGTLDLGFRRDGAVTRLTAGHQGGCLRARLPRVDPGEPIEAVLINTAGGLTGGDRLDQTINWHESAVATVCSQAAEKVYRAIDDPARVSTRIGVAASAEAEWLPQETILFDRAALDRSTEVEIASNARLLAVEAMVFGRTAMGETMIRGALVDRWRVRRDGRPVYLDALRLGDTPQAELDIAAIGDGARAIATLLLIAPDACAQLPNLRAVIEGLPGRSAASSWNGLLVARFLAPDGDRLRQALLPALACLRGGRPMPRVWSC